ETHTIKKTDIPHIGPKKHHNPAHDNRDRVQQDICSYKLCDTSDSQSKKDHHTIYDQMEKKKLHDSWKRDGYHHTSEKASHCPTQKKAPPRRAAFQNVIKSQKKQA